MTQIQSRWNDIVVTMHGLPHVVIKKELLTGCQSWIEGAGENQTFHIRFYMSAGRDIKCEYWDRKHWEAVLTEITKLDLFAI